MVDTARTTSYLLSTTFPDGQSAGISANDMRDLVVSVPNRIDLVANVKWYGAFGDGSSHPASTLYPSNAAVQAYYGATLTSGGITITPVTTMELDYLATMLALKTVAVTGGTVAFTDGVYIMTNANSVSDGSGQIGLPSRDYPPVTSGANVVNMLGEGPATILKWPNDLGTGKYAVICNANRTGATYLQNSMGFIKGMSFIGPTAITTFGTPATNMMGIGTANRRQIEEIFVENFWCGIEIQGGQFYHRHIDIAYCHYGYYWGDDANQGNSPPDEVGYQHGNSIFERVLVELCTAALAVHHRAIIDCDVFTSCFFGACPYSILKLTNAGSPTHTDVLVGCTFYLTQFENFGQAVITDDTANNTTRVCTVQDCIFDCCQFSNDLTATYKIPGGTFYAVIDIGGWYRSKIRQINNPWLVTPGTISVFNILTTAGFYYEGYIQTILNNCGSIPFVSGSWHIGTNRIFAQDGPWEGVITYADAAEAVNDCVIINGFETLPCTGTATEVPLGVCRYYPPSSAFVVIAVSGWTTVKTSGVVTANLRLFTAASAATITSATTTAPIGCAIANAGTNVWYVWLRGLL